MAEAEECRMIFILSCVEKWLAYEFEAYVGMDDHRQARENAREALELTDDRPDERADWCRPDCSCRGGMA
jgi:hypothetical protein